MPFIQMENISHFLAGAEKLGVPKHDLFQTVDLYEKKNMTQVGRVQDGRHTNVTL